jgi:hypothetical protein
VPIFIGCGAPLYARARRGSLAFPVSALSFQAHEVIGHVRYRMQGAACRVEPGEQSTASPLKVGAFASTADKGERGES